MIVTDSVVLVSKPSKNPKSLTVNSVYYTSKELFYLSTTMACGWLPVSHIDIPTSVVSLIDTVNIVMYVHVVISPSF